MQAGARLSQCVSAGGDLRANIERVAAEAEQVARQGTQADAAALYVVDAPARSMTTLTPQHGFTPRQRFPIWLSCTAEAVATGRPWSAVRGPRVLCVLSCAAASSLQRLWLWLVQRCGPGLVRT